MHILEETDDEFIFPDGSLTPGADNVIIIVQVGVYQFLICFPEATLSRRTIWA